MKLENTMSAAEESAVQNLLSEIAINYCSWSENSLLDYITKSV